jgi:hypothetical protein
LSETDKHNHDNASGIRGFSVDSNFIPDYAVPYTNVHTKFLKNLSIFVKSKAYTNMYYDSFHAKTVSISTAERIESSGLNLKWVPPYKLAGKLFDFTLLVRYNVNGI